MHLPKYILVKVGCLADGRGADAYQVFEMVVPGDPVYHPVQGIQNDPVRLIAAARRLALLKTGEIAA